MKKFVLCLFAAVAAFALTTGAAAVTNNAGTGGGLAGAAENIVGGAVQGAENIVGGVVRGAEDMVGGTGNNHYYNRGVGSADNKDHPIPRANENIAGNNNLGARGAENRREDRNPATGIGFGIVEIATVGATMLGAAAIAGGKKRR
jgi:hypothetical protein